TCKPQIRKQAQKGDWIVGTGSATTIGVQKMIYAAQITKVVPLVDYGRLSKYKIKRPSDRGRAYRKHGDNIYIKVEGRWRRRPNIHHPRSEMTRDLRGKNVLVCNRYWYFGDAAEDLPGELRGIVKRGRGHKRIKDESLVQLFVNWLITRPRGRLGN